MKFGQPLPRLGAIAVSPAELVDVLFGLHRKLGRIEVVLRKSFLITLIGNLAQLINLPVIVDIEVGHMQVGKPFHVGRYDRPA